MRLAFFGGSFDPPHLGHLAIARAAAQRLQLDRVLLAPTGRQPLKTRHGATFAERLRMVELLVEGEDRLQASDADAPISTELDGVPKPTPDYTPNPVPNYTVDTLARLRPRLPAGAELFFLAGADSFLTLHHWRSPEQLLQLPQGGGLLDGWILAARPGFPLDDLARALPAGYCLGRQSSAPGPVLTQTVLDPLGCAGTPLHLLPDLHDPATATRIREALARGESTPFLTRPVEALIREHRLYGGRDPVLR